MLYDLRTKYEQEKAVTYLNKLIEGKKAIELKQRMKKRTIHQNSYIHVLFGLFGAETGLTMEEAKIALKREYKVLTYEKNMQKFLRSTADLSKEEMMLFISWIIEFSGMQGIHLPSPEEYINNQIEIEKELDKVKQYQ